MQRTRLVRVAVCCVLVLATGPPLRAQTPILDALLKELQSLRPVTPPPVIVPPVVVPPVVVPPSGVVKVAVGGNIQAAIDAAPNGTEIRIAPGAYAVNLVLRAGKSGIVLRSDVADPVLTMPWITPAVVTGKLAVLTPADASAPVIATAFAGSGYTLRLLEIGPNLVLPDRSLVELGDFAQTTLAQVPQDLVVDRCYIHGSEAKGGHRGISLNSGRTTITKSFISNMWEQGRDSQAIGGANGPGPYLIESNYLEGSGENIIFGGSDPRVPNLVPSDIVIRGNHVFKPLRWKVDPAVPGSGRPGSVKNLLELKNAQRVLIEYNVFENNWTDAQSGNGILFNVRNQDGTCPWCTVQDVTFRMNVVKNVAGFAFNLLGHDDEGKVSGQGKTVVVTQNLLLKMGNGLLIAAGFQPTSFTHNTLTGAYGMLLGFNNPVMPSGTLTLVDNVVDSGLYGMTGGGLTIGLPVLTAFAPGSTFHHNVIAVPADYAAQFPPGNWPTLAAPFAAGLDASFRYIGSQVASDGSKLGVDVDALRKAIPWWAFP